MAGLSVHKSDYGREAAERLHLPFPFILIIRRKWLRHSDCQTFEVSGLKLPRRLSMIILDGQIEKISYPRIHPLRNAAEGVEWLKKSGSEANRAAVKTPFDQGSNRPAALICRGPLTLQLTQFCRCSQNAPSFWTRRRSGKHRQHRSRFHATGHGVLSSSRANPTRVQSPWAIKLGRIIARYD